MYTHTCKHIKIIRCTFFGVYVCRANAATSSASTALATSGLTRYREVLLPERSSRREYRQSVIHHHRLKISLILPQGKRSDFLGQYRTRHFSLSGGHALTPPFLSFLCLYKHLAKGQTQTNFPFCTFAGETQRLPWPVPHSPLQPERRSRTNSPFSFLSMFIQTASTQRAQTPTNFPFCTFAGETQRLPWPIPHSPLQPERRTAFLVPLRLHCPTRLYHTGPQYGVGIERLCDGARLFADGKIYIYTYICVSVYIHIYILLTLRTPPPHTALSYLARVRCWRRVTLLQGAPFRSR